jgi:hypothetical protein
MAVRTDSTSFNWRTAPISAAPPAGLEPPGNEPEDVDPTGVEADGNELSRAESCTPHAQQTTRRGRGDGMERESEIRKIAKIPEGFSGIPKSAI